MAQRRKKAPPVVVRRPDGERKRLDPEFERLASGEDKRLRPRPGRPRLRDDRARALMPGVANRDARAVFDARLVRLERHRKGHPDDPAATKALTDELQSVCRLRLWRGRSLTGFDAFVDQLLGLTPEQARWLLGGQVPEPVTDEAAAACVRAEAALLEAGLDGRADVVLEEGQERLRLDLPGDRASEALTAIGRRTSPLARDQEPPTPDRGRGPKPDRPSGRPPRDRRPDRGRGPKY